jgi:hypothetical protein
VSGSSNYEPSRNSTPLPFEDVNGAARASLRRGAWGCVAHHYPVELAHEPGDGKGGPRCLAVGVPPCAQPDVWGCALSHFGVRLAQRRVHGGGPAFGGVGDAGGLQNLSMGPGSLLGGHVAAHPSVDVVSGTPPRPLIAATGTRAADSLRRGVAGTARSAGNIFTRRCGRREGRDAGCEGLLCAIQVRAQRARTACRWCAHLYEKAVDISGRERSCRRSGRWEIPRCARHLPRPVAAEAV